MRGPILTAGQPKTIVEFTVIQRECIAKWLLAISGDAATYPPWRTGSLREILGQSGQSCPQIPKPQRLKDMGLAKRLAKGWPIGQPVANPSEISLEQQTD